MMQDMSDVKIMIHDLPNVTNLQDNEAGFVLCVKLTK